MEELAEVKTADIELVEASSTEEANTSLVVESPEVSSNEIAEERRAALSFKADLKAQQNRNYKKASNSMVGVCLMASIACATVSGLHSLLTRPNPDWLLGISWIALAVLVRYLIVNHKAESFGKIRYALDDENLFGIGPWTSQDWFVPVNEIRRAVIVPAGNGSKDIIVGGQNESYTVTGLLEPEKLFAALPQNRTADCSAMREKLQSLADSIGDCIDVEVREKFKDKKHMQELIEERLQEFPDKRIYCPDVAGKAGIMLESLWAALFVAIIAALRCTEAALSVLPLLLAAFHLDLSKVQKVSDCIYVLCSDSLFEIDCRQGHLQQITLDRVTLSASKLDGKNETVTIDKLMSIPISFEQESFDYFKACLSNYPHKE